MLLQLLHQLDGACEFVHLQQNSGVAPVRGQLCSFDRCPNLAVRTEAWLHVEFRGSAPDLVVSLDCDDVDGPPDFAAAGAGSLIFNPPREAFS